jgi:hypothetical protein
MKPKRYIKLDGKLCASKSFAGSRCSKRRVRLLGIEVDTRVGYDTLGINGLAGSTAMGILVEYDVTLVFDELGKMTVSSNLSLQMELDTNLAGTNGMDDRGPASRRSL